MNHNIDLLVTPDPFLHDHLVFKPAFDYELVLVTGKNALSINKGAMLGVLTTLPLALPVIILLGTAIRSIQYEDGFLEISSLMIGVSFLISAIMPLIISTALKTHID